jgi:hypothetical protein
MTARVTGSRSQNTDAHGHRVQLVVQLTGVQQIGQHGVPVGGRDDVGELEQLVPLGQVAQHGRLREQRDVGRVVALDTGGDQLVDVAGRRELDVDLVVPGPEADLLLEGVTQVPRHGVHDLDRLPLGLPGGLGSGRLAEAADGEEDDGAESGTDRQGGSAGHGHVLRNVLGQAGVRTTAPRRRS